MNSHGTFFPPFARDLSVVAALALLGVGVGLTVNAWRAQPLPMRYLPKAERLQQAVQPYLPQPGTLPAASKVIPVDLKTFREMVEGKAARVLDARPEVFYQLGHVPGAISLPREDFEARYGVLRAELERDKARAIVVYCSDPECEDSPMVAEALLKLAYPGVFVFRGGWSAWTEAHLPEEKTP
jgi:rhodanese-related sulfurtransferase